MNLNITAEENFHAEQCLQFQLFGNKIFEHKKDDKKVKTMRACANCLWPRLSRCKFAKISEA